MRRLLPEELDRVAGGYDPEDPYASIDPDGGLGGDDGGDDGGIGGDDGGGGDPGGGGGGNPDPITMDDLAEEILDLIDLELAAGVNYLDPAWTAGGNDGSGGSPGHDQNSYYWETLGQQIMSNFDMQFQAFQQEAGDYFAHQQAVQAFQASLNQAIANGDDIAPYLIQLGYNLPPGTVTAAQTSGGQTIYTFTEGDGDVSPVIVIANCDSYGSISSLIFTSGQGWNLAGGIYDKASQALDALEAIQGALELIKNADAVNTPMVSAEHVRVNPDGSWSYAITDENNQFAGWVTITSTGWFFENSNDIMTFNKEYPTNWGTLEGVIYQEQLAFQDRAWGNPLSKVIQAMFFGPLNAAANGLMPVVIDILGKFGLNATGWAAGQGNPDLFVRAQEVAYEMRKLKLQGYNPPN